MVLKWFGVFPRSRNFASFNRVVDTKTNITQMGPNTLNIGLK